jgi:hypothetical protein
MFSGTSTPSSARIARPKNVQLVKFSPVFALGRQVLKSNGLTAA